MIATYLTHAWHHLRAKPLRAVAATLSITCGITAVSLTLAPPPELTPTTTASSERHLPHHPRTLLTTARQPRLRYLQAAGFRHPAPVIEVPTHLTPACCLPPEPLTLTATTPAAATTRTMNLIAGRWLHPRDTTRYAPVLVLNTTYTRTTHAYTLGSRTHALLGHHVRLHTPRPIDALVIGVIEDHRATPTAYTPLQAQSTWGLHPDNVGLRAYVLTPAPTSPAPQRPAGLIAALILAAGILGAINTAMTATSARARELTLLHTTGTPRAHLAAMIYAEVGLLATLAGLTGVLVALTVRATLIGVSATDIVTTLGIGLILAPLIAAAIATPPALLAHRTHPSGP